MVSARKVLRRMRLGSALALSAVWVMLWGTVTPGTIVMAVAVAIFVLAVFPMPRVATKIRIRPLSLLWLALLFNFHLVTASIQVGWMAIRPGGVRRGSILKVPLTDTDDLRRTIVSEMTSLVPGTVVIDLHPDSGILVIHVLDYCTAERKRIEVEKVLALETRVARAFGGPAELCERVVSRGRTSLPETTDRGAAGESGKGER